MAYKVAVYMEWMPPLDGLPRRRRSVDSMWSPFIAENFEVTQVSSILSAIEESIRAWE